MRAPGQDLTLPSAAAVVAAARAVLEGGRPAWLVGGCVRDELLGLPVEDVDIVVESGADAFSRALAERLGAAAFLSSEAYGAWRVVLGELRVDVTPLGGLGIEDDLARRDFTVDAMARPLAGGELLDPWAAAAIWRRGDCASAGPTALADDPLRILRLARLAYGLRLSPDAEAVAAATAASPGLALVSGERVRDELNAVLATGDAADAIRDLAAWGALAVVLPEVDALRGVEQNDYHHLDVFGHTLEALTFVAGVVAQLGGERQLATPAEVGLPGSRALVPVTWALLLHDIGKPAARRVDAEGRVLFWSHDEFGREMSAGIARRLRLSNRFTAFVGTLIRQHLRLGFLVHERPLTRRALARYRRAVSPWVFESIVVSLCDRLATRGEKTSPEAMARHYRLARSAWGAVEKAPPPRMLSGEDVMALLGIGPGRDVGRALAALDEEVEAGEVTSAEEARAFLVNWWNGDHA